jgi:medium-chain acyl-[acyl-carrier-protein] hydrolase
MMPKIVLFCLPYAGGSAAIFSSWQKYLDPRIVFKPLELAGRGKRIQDKLYENTDEAVADIFRLIAKEVGDLPFALFGHSLGCYIAYLLTHYLREKKERMPLHIFLSGRIAPHVKRKNEKKYHLMSDEEFKLEVVRLGGTPAEFFDHPELMELFLPLLKNDFRLAEEECFSQQFLPLNQNISVLLGTADELTSDQADGWSLHTTKVCKVNHFEGGHFFINEHPQQIVELINYTLLDELALK